MDETTSVGGDFFVNLLSWCDMNISKFYSVWQAEMVLVFVIIAFTSGEVLGKSVALPDDSGLYVKWSASMEKAVREIYAFQKGVLAHTSRQAIMFSRISGKKQWQSATGGEIVLLEDNKCYYVTTRRVKGRVLGTAHIVCEDIKKGTEIWAYNCEFPGVPVFATVKDGIIYGDNDGNLIQVNKSDGRGKVIANIDGEAYSLLVVNENLMLVSTKNGNIVLLTSEGKVRWQHTVGGSIGPGPGTNKRLMDIGIWRDKVVVGPRARNGRATALLLLDLDSGKICSKIKVHGSLSSSLLIHEDVAYFACGVEDICAVHLAKGRVLWKRPSEDFLLQQSKEGIIRHGYVVGPKIAALDGRIYVSMYHHSVYGESDLLVCLSSNSGQILWKAELPGLVQWGMVSTGDAIAIGDNKGKVYYLSLVEYDPSAIRYAIAYYDLKRQVEKQAPQQLLGLLSDTGRKEDAIRNLLRFGPLIRKDVEKLAKSAAGDSVKQSCMVILKSIEEKSSCYAIVKEKELFKNLIYLANAFQLLDNKEQVFLISHLKEITAWKCKEPNSTLAMEDFHGWYTENGIYLSWNDQKKRWELVDSAKRAGIAFNIWNLIPQKSQLTWSTLSDEEKANLIVEAEKNLFEQEEKKSENPEQETSGEKASQPSEIEPSK